MLVHVKVNEELLSLIKENRSQFIREAIRERLTRQGMDVSKIIDFKGTMGRPKTLTVENLIPILKSMKVKVKKEGNYIGIVIGGNILKGSILNKRTEFKKMLAKQIAVSCEPKGFIKYSDKLFAAMLLNDCSELTKVKWSKILKKNDLGLW